MNRQKFFCANQSAPFFRKGRLPYNKFRYRFMFAVTNGSANGENGSTVENLPTYEDVVQISQNDVSNTRVSHNQKG